jgi:putative RecB family exonuclease
VSGTTVVQTEPVAPEARPKYLSPSSVSTFQQCPLRYRYSRIDKLPEPSTEAQLLGSIAHEVLELLLALPGPERTLDRARTILLEQWHDHWLADAEQLGLSDYDLHMFRWRVWQCIETYFTLEDPTAQNLSGIECRLETDIAGVPVLGILDRWHLAEDGTAIISDYKTGKVASKRYDGEKRFQLMVYVTLAEKILDVTVSRAELIYLKGRGARVGYEPTLELRAEVETTLAATWSAVQTACDTGEFETRVSRLCDWCSYKGICPAFTKRG